MLGTYKMYVLFIGLLISHLTVHGQISWEKFYYDGNGIFGNIVNTEIDIRYDSTYNKYVFSGLGHEQQSIYEISADNGDMIFRNYFSGAIGACPTSKFVSKKGVIISSSEPDSGIHVIKTIYKLDSLYNIQWKYQNYWTISVPSCGLTETTDRNFLLAPTHYSPVPHPFLLKMDSLGNLVWAREFYNIDGFANISTQTVDGNYLLGLNLRNNMGFALSKIDTSGNVIWAKSYLRPQGVVIDLLEKPNGNLILAGNTDTTSQTLYPKLFLMEIEAAGTVLWTKTYGDDVNRLVSFGGNSYSYDPIKIKKTFDGGYTILTTLNFQSSDADLVLLKTDSIGNLQWEKRHGNGPDLEVGINLIQALDSGYFVVGAFYKNIMQTGYYLLKTDSLGSVDCNEFSDSIVVSSLLPTDSSITVTDSVIVINQYIALVTNTTDASPDSLPGCIPVNIKEFYKSWLTPVVFPNPTAGVFHISIPEGLKGEKNIFVYDLLGKEIYSKQNATERKFDIDLSENAKGIYLLKVSTSEGSATVKVFLF